MNEYKESIKRYSNFLLYLFVTSSSGIGRSDRGGRGGRDGGAGGISTEVGKLFSFWATSDRRQHCTKP